jgi:hypothetical protein
MSVFMQPLFSRTVGAGGVSSILFNNIPQSFDDLKVVISAKDTRALELSDVQLVINEDTNPNYSTTHGYAYLGSSLQYQERANQTNMWIMSGTGNLASQTNFFGNAEMYIPNYSFYHAKTVYGSDTESTTGANFFIREAVGLWRGSVPVTSIRLIALIPNFFQHTTVTVYGILQPKTRKTLKATGGEICQGIDGYVYHTFTSSGSFVPTSTVVADVLVIAGGGGGGAGDNGGSGGGGGGGGGALYTSGLTLALGSTYSASVGNGGAGGTIGNAGAAGQNSTFSGSGITTRTAIGGGFGGGGGGAGASVAGSGGSGGGSARTGAAGAGTSLQGTAGGTGSGGGGAGGGGAGSSGSANSGNTGGAGGAGANYFFGFWSAGGSGGTGAQSGGANTFGSIGGGATGGASAQAGFAGMKNTGSGGGGGGAISGTSPAGGAGGSGIIIVRYT